MANPGYPPMGGPMQPPGGPPMGAGPMGPMGGPMGMGPMGMHPPMRQGTSHIVPVVVAAGLAVGVFCGLLFGLGTRRDTGAPSRGGTGAKQSEESQIQTAQVSMGTKIPDTSRPPTGSAAQAAQAGSAAGSAGSNAGSAAAGAGSAAEPRPGKLTIEIEPESAAKAARVTVDGLQVTSTTVDIPFEPGVTKKSVKIVVRVPGYKDMEKAIEVESEAASSISFDLKGVRLTAGASSDDTSKAGAGAAGSGSASGAAGGAATGSGGKGTGSGTKPGGNKGSGKGSGKTGLIDI